MLIVLEQVIHPTSAIPFLPGVGSQVSRFPDFLAATDFHSLHTRLALVLCERETCPIIPGVSLPFCWPASAYHVGLAPGCLPWAGLAL